MNTITFTPEMVYKDLLSCKGNKMATIKNAMNAFIEVSSFIETIDKDSVIEHITTQDRKDMIEVLAFTYLLDNEKEILDLKDSFQQDEYFIKLELIKIDKSLLIECDKEVLEALKKTRHKWLLKLLKNRKDIETANKILAILMLLNRESCK